MKRHINYDNLPEGCKARQLGPYAIEVKLANGGRVCISACVDSFKDVIESAVRECNHSPTNGIDTIEDLGAKNPFRIFLRKSVEDDSVVEWQVFMEKEEGSGVLGILLSDDGMPDMKEVYAVLGAIVIVL